MGSFFPANPLGRRVLYELLHAWSALKGITMFNVGYSPIAPDISSNIRFNREPFQYQLYSQILGSIAEGTSELRILEVGAGGGGGLVFMKQRFPKARVTGIDNTWVAALRGKLAGLDFRYAPAEHLPFGTEELDCIICVDSFSIFPRAEFLSEVKRTLRPSGVLLIGDYLSSSAAAIESENLKAASEAGFDVVRFENLTPGVVEALDLDHGRKRDLIKSLPKALKQQLEETMSMPGTDRYTRWKSGTNTYYLTAWCRSAKV